MPVEIRELIIRANIDDEDAGSTGPTTKAATGAQPPAIDREKLIASCVEQVMALLRERAER